MKDVKATSTSNDLVTGSFQTLDLNTIQGDQSFLSLSSNAFTLEAGTYHIEAKVPVYRTDFYQTKIRNISDSVDSIIGTNGYSSFADNGETVSYAEGVISITSSKTFELQGIATNTGGSWGTGYNSGISNIYASIKVTKIR